MLRKNVPGALALVVLLAACAQEDIPLPAAEHVAEEKEATTPDMPEVVISASRSSPQRRG